MFDLSIIIINKNYLKYLKYSLDSCINQVTTFKYEIILIDDGSIDGSFEFAKKIENKKLKVFQTKGIGIEKACNKGFKKSKAKYILRVDSDDYLHKNFINIMLTAIIKYKTAFVYSNYYLIRSNNKIIKKIRLPKFKKGEILKRGDFLATGTIYNKDIIRKIGFYNESKKNSGLENYELILKLISNKYCGKNINKFLFYYRKHDKNISYKKKNEILSFGKIIFENMKLGKYSRNKYHPWK